MTIDLGNSSALDYKQKLDVYKCTTFVENCNRSQENIYASFFTFTSLKIMTILSENLTLKGDMMAAKKENNQVQKRKKAVSTLLNEAEYDAINKYCQKYKVRNRSKMIRDFVFSAILDNYERDYPTLWDRQVMADLVVEKR